MKQITHDPRPPRAEDVMRCRACGRLDTWLEASRRKFDPERCAVCGGFLEIRRLAGRCAAR